MPDWLIQNALVVTFDAARRQIEDGAILVRDGLIHDLGPTAELTVRYPSATPYATANQAVIPGLVNAHTHIAMVPFRGLTHDRKDILYNVVWPIETSLTGEDCYHLARLGALEALKAGTTCVADHYFFMEEIAQAVAECGIRGILGHTVMEMGGPMTGPDQLAAGFSFWERWQGRHPRVLPLLAPHAPDTVSPAWLREMKEFADLKGTYLHLHLAQTKWELQRVREMYGTTSVRHLAMTGFLDANVVAAHCIYIDAAEIDLLAKTGVTAVYCPSTHAFTGHVAPVPAMLAAGIRVGIGTDYVAENDDHNLLEEMRLATMLQKVAGGDPQALPTREVVGMAFGANPRAFGMERELGSIEVGKKADLVFVDLETPRMVPRHNIVNNLVYASSEADITAVMVDGEFVLRDRRVLTVDEGEVIRQARLTCESILQRALAKQPALKQYLDR